MTRMRSTTVALLACAVIGAAGCQSEEAAKKDAGNAIEDAKKGLDKAGQKAKEAARDAQK